MKKLFILLLLGLSACGQQKVSGYIAQKIHTDAYITYEYIPEKVGNITILQQYPVSHPATWVFVVQDCKDYEVCRDVEWDVSKDVYNQYEVGQPFSDTYGQ